MTALLATERIPADAATAMNTLRDWALDDDAVHMRLSPVVPRFYYSAETGCKSLTYWGTRVEFSGEFWGGRVRVLRTTETGETVVGVFATVYDDDTGAELYAYESCGTVAEILENAFTGAYDGD